MRDFFLYIKQTVLELEEEINLEAGDNNYTDKQAELLNILYELEDAADRALERL